MILSHQDRENFSRLVVALGPWLGQTVIVGGWAYRLYRLHPVAQRLDYPPVATLDADVALPSRLPAGDPDLRQRLLSHGFHEELLGHHQPPVTHYHLGSGAEGFYVEFLTPLIGSPYQRNQKSKSTTKVAGVISQNLRHVDLLLHSPWSVDLVKTAGFPGAGSARAQIANPAAFIAQKLLINAKRPAADRAKDILYIHDTIETFGSSLNQIRAQWHANLKKHLHSNTIRSIHQAIKSLFTEGNDLVREAAIMAIGRRILPVEMAKLCETGLMEIFD